jgi:hypothetical protein
VLPREMELRPAMSRQLTSRMRWASRRARICPPSPQGTRPRPGRPATPSPRPDLARSGRLRSRYRAALRAAVLSA